MEGVEYSILAVIIVLQLSAFVFGWYKTRQLAFLYPFKEGAYSRQDLSQNSAHALIKIEPKSCSNVFQRLVADTNAYLESNQGGITSFDLIKNISERYNNRVEHSIRAIIPVPLYIGLMGTMLGIVLGLSGMGDFQNLEDTAELSPLLRGVEIAMVGSIVGLFLTLLGSAWLFRWAKLRRDKFRNEYYKFIQTHLMPGFSTDAGSQLVQNIGRIEVGLAQFNTDFKENTAHLERAATAVLEKVDGQIKYAEAINQIDFEATAQAIINMYGNIASNLVEFEKFNAYQAGMNSAVSDATGAIESAGRIFHKIASLDENITSVLGQISQQISTANAAMELIKSQYKGIESVGDFTKSLVSKQEARLKHIYNDFETTLNSISSKLKDMAAESVSHSRTELKALTTNAGDALTNELGKVKAEISAIYEDENMAQVQRDLRVVGTVATEVKEQNLTADKMQKAAEQIQHSVAELSQLSAKLLHARESDKQSGYRQVLLRSLVQGSVFTVFLAGIYLLYRVVFFSAS